MKVSETILGQAHGKDVVAYTLTNPNGISLTAMTYGAHHHGIDDAGQKRKE